MLRVTACMRRYVTRNYNDKETEMAISHEDKVEAIQRADMDVMVRLLAFIVPALEGGINNLETMLEVARIQGPRLKSPEMEAAYRERLISIYEKALKELDG